VESAYGEANLKNDRNTLTLARTDHQYFILKKVMFVLIYKSDQYINDSHSPGRRLYPPACKPYGLEAEAGAGFSHFSSL